MRYGELLTRSFFITWRHRYLWFLALFAGEAGGGSGGSGGNFGNAGAGFGNSGRTGGYGPAPPNPAEIQAAVSSWFSENLGLVVAIAVIVFVLALALFLFSCVAQPALVRASAEHDADRPYGL